ncbi:SCO6880 family protein (plasmid) [Clavibacter michiganensis]|uniref:SCO6880 family protein n=1 Tax=Clavibacter michiganensis TaxID=28447 RepID=UPI003DA03CB2
MSETVKTTERVKFGNWLPTAKPTFGGLTKIGGWGVLLTSIFLMLIAVTFGAWAFGLWILALALLWELLFVLRFGLPNAGRTIAARCADRLSHRSRNSAGSTVYRTGIFTALPNDALLALPGPLSALDEIDGVDGEGAPFVLLHHMKNSSTPTLTATFVCNPDGTSMLPQEAVDNQVVEFGGWIASLSADEAIEGAVIVVDSSLASSAPLVEKIAAGMSPSAPDLAKRALLEGARRLPASSSSVEVFATVAWARKELGDTVEDAAAEVAARLPDHRAALANAGAGRPFVATSEDLARSVRIAYRPDREQEIALDELAGRPFTLRVSDAGPDEFDDSARRICYHDGVASVTVMMLAPPQKLITEDSMNALFRPQDKFLRKRVAVFWRPLTPGEAVRRAAELRRSTGVAATSKAMASSLDTKMVAFADQTEVDLVTGASMTRFAIEVTVTFEPNPRAQRDALQKLKGLLAATDLTWRFIETNTAAGFHSTLPLGLLPWQYETFMQHLAEGGN